MNIDSTDIINKLVQHKDSQIQITQMFDTTNLSSSCLSADVYIGSHIDSLAIRIDNQSACIQSILSASATNTIYEILTIWSIPLIISLIAMAAPLLIQHINELDSKYNSTRIVDIFQTSVVFNTFKYTVIILAIAIIIKLVTWTFAWSSILLLLIGSIFLLVTVLLCSLIMRFYRYPQLIKHAQLMYESKLYSNKKELYFRALIDCLHYAIRKNDKKTTNELLTYFESKFTNFRKHKMGDTYPQEYYDFIMETTDFICRENYTNVIYQDSENGHVLPIQFLFPKIEENSSIGVSKQAYKIIWKTLLMLCNYKHEELFASYWNCINTYYSQKITYDDNTVEFIEFHECVGALLMAYKQYSVLYNLIFWTDKHKKRNDALHHFWNITLTPEEKLITLKVEDVMLRYIRIMNVLDKTNYNNALPNISATSDNPNPLKVYCQKYMALLYLLSCDAKDKNTFFFINEEDDLQLPENISLQTIEKLTNELYLEAKLLYQDSSLSTAFSHLKNMTEVPSLLHFVEVIKANFALHTRIQDINPKVYDAIYQVIDEKITDAVKDFPFNLTSSARGKKTVLKKIYSISLLKKDDLSKNELPKSTYTTLGSKVYCSIISEAFDVIKKYKHDTTTSCKYDAFILQLNKVLSTLNQPNDYILICEDSRAEKIFDKLEEYKDKVYKGVSVLISTIYYPKKNEIKVWLIKKDNLPVYKIALSTEIQDIHEYHFEMCNDKYKTQRIVLDLGRVTSTVLGQLKKEIPKQLIPNNCNIEDLVLISVMIPVDVFTNKSACTIHQWNIEDIPVYTNENLDYWGDDYEEPDDYISAHIITPKEHNEKLNIKY